MFGDFFFKKFKVGTYRTVYEAVRTRRMAKSEYFTRPSLLFSTCFTSKYVVLYGFVEIAFSFLYRSSVGLGCFFGNR